MVKAKATQTEKEVVKLAKTIELSEQNLEYVKDYNGELKPVNEVTTITPTGGDVKINFKNGDKVKRRCNSWTYRCIDRSCLLWSWRKMLLKAKSSYSTDKSLMRNIKIICKRTCIWRWVFKF